jgi:hypothetical protein
MFLIVREGCLKFKHARKWEVRLNYDRNCIPSHINWPALNMRKC